LKNGKFVSKGRLSRENILKNIVMNHVEKVRIYKRKPKLQDILK